MHTFFELATLILSIEVFMNPLNRLSVITLSLSLLMSAGAISAAGGYKAIIPKLGKPHRGTEKISFEEHETPHLGEFVTVDRISRSGDFGQEITKDPLGYVEEINPDGTCMINFGDACRLEASTDSLFRIDPHLYIGSTETITGSRQESRKLRTGQVVRILDTVCLVTSVDTQNKVFTVIDGYTDQAASTSVYDFNDVDIYRVAATLQKQRRYAIGGKSDLTRYYK